MKIFDYFKSKNLSLPTLSTGHKFKWVLIGLAGLILLLLVFQLGMFVGFRKANFAFRWGDNYHRMFGGPRGGFMRDFAGRDFTSGHGVAGTVISFDENTVVVKGSDDVEKVVITTPDTVVKRGRQTIQLSSLNADDRVVIIGTPQDDGSIAAKLIRVFSPLEAPPSPAGMFGPIRF